MTEKWTRKKSAFYFNTIEEVYFKFNKINNFEIILFCKILKYVFKGFYKREVIIMNREKIEEKVEKIIIPYVMELNLDLVDVEYIQDGAYFYLRIYVEKINGDISLEDCANLSNTIEEKVDAVIEDKFFLEISSPGLERPIKKENDYIRFTGEKIKLLLKNKIEDSRNLTGILEKYQDGKIYLNIDKVVHEINFDDVKKANLVFEFNDF